MTARRRARLHRRRRAQARAPQLAGPRAPCRRAPSSARRHDARRRCARLRGFAPHHWTPHCSQTAGAALPSRCAMPRPRATPPARPPGAMAAAGNTRRGRKTPSHRRMTPTCRSGMWRGGWRIGSAAARRRCGGAGTRWRRGRGGASERWRRRRPGGPPRRRGDAAVKQRGTGCRAAAARSHRAAAARWRRGLLRAVTTHSRSRCMSARPSWGRPRRAVDAVALSARRRRRVCAVSW
jgi:hypothetical protein